MCGIIGYVGPGRASQIITEGLKRLEYRGYDSVGIAVRGAQGKVEVRKDKGMVEGVSEALRFSGMNGNIGLGHTRWATHGAVCRENAHPHADCTGNVILAHNGVIENYSVLRDALVSRGHKFASDTDSEVVAHLIEENLRKEPPLKAFMRAVGALEGSYAIVAMAGDDKEERLFLARRNSPLVIGVGKGEMLCASDIPAMLKYTKTFVPLQEGDFAMLTRHGYKVYAPDGSEAVRKQVTVDWDVEMAQKGGYPHFMLKEIMDQKHFVMESLSADVSEAKRLIAASGRIDIVAAGTSYHAGLMLSYLLQASGKTAQAFIASDYPFIAKPGADTLIVAISQSGETADVLQALRFGKACRKIVVTNVVGSTITTLADTVILMNAGPEVGVAATKTFTSTLAVVYRLFHEKAELKALPALIGAMLAQEDDIRKIARRIAGSENAFFIARGRNVPIACEGSLKFKEITYIHSEAYPGGELKHGTLSLITKGVPVIALAPKDDALPKMLGNIREAKARGAFILSLTDDEEVRRESDISIPLPAGTEPLLYPFALTVPLQLLAYHTSVQKGINPDRPRNLAKSVTVE
jgi:glutamine---fructose-6-phosphate transaminase (isomerizing)